MFIVALLFSFLFVFCFGDQSLSKPSPNGNIPCIHAASRSGTMKRKRCRPPVMITCDDSKVLFAFFL